MRPRACVVVVLSSAQGTGNPNSEGGLTQAIHDLEVDGYVVGWECLMAIRVGFPQKRERCYFFARLNRTLSAAAG